MTDWKGYWNADPRLSQFDDPLKQVGKTVNGKAIAPHQVEALVADILSKLKILSTDSVLDLCCGNGLITRRCADHCRSITGVDYSEPLIRIARESFWADNISYLLGDARELGREITLVTFDKIYMYEALQHLEPAGVGKMLRTLRTSASHNAPVLLASVPDEELIWSYYNTPARRSEYYRRKASGSEAIGHWWTKSTVTRIALECGYDAQFHVQNPALHTAHYRFDALLSPIATNQLR